MQGDDFFGTENSVTLSAAGSARIEFVDASGKAEVLKKGIKLQAGEVIDSSCMKVASLQEFFAKEIEAAKKDGVMPKVNVAVGSRKKKKKGGLAAPLAERAPAEEPAEVSAR